MQRFQRWTAMVLLVLAAPLAVHADDAHRKIGAAAAGVPAADTSTTAGVVKKVDKDQGKITIQHGPLENLGMPAMTMVFHVKDAEMLDKVKAGDSVDFVAKKINGAFTVTKIEAAK